MSRIGFIDDFSALGNLLNAYLMGQTQIKSLDSAIKQSIELNPWFTQSNIKERLKSIVHHYLQPQMLNSWLSNYPDVWYGYQKDIAVVMAGNIPLVGYHDYLSVLASGRTVSIKRSSKDPFLLPALHELLCNFTPEWCSKVRYVTHLPADTNGLIATGSDTTAAWFTTHYTHLPKIIRGHGVSVAVLPKELIDEQISGLHNDMFLYFGLGCRSVVRLYIPKGFDLLRITTFASLPKEASHPGFYNAYRRNKALLTLQKLPFTDGGFFILQPVDGFNPPMATIYYTIYNNLEDVRSDLERNASFIQCVVGMGTDIKKSVTFGSAQHPQLWDYANEKDTMRL